MENFLKGKCVLAVHRHRIGVGSIPAGGPIVGEFFSTVPVRISTCAIFPLFSSLHISLYISHSLTKIFIRDFRFMKRANICSVLNFRPNFRGGVIFPWGGGGGGANEGGGHWHNRL